jgi:transposase
MVREAIAESRERVGAVSREARQLGMGPESLRNWVKQAEVDTGKRPGVTTEQQRRITELEREVRELRRANEILKAASAFFAAGPRPATTEVVSFINAHKERWGVEPICKVLQFAPSTYYAACGLDEIASAARVLTQVRKWATAARELAALRSSG